METKTCDLVRRIGDDGQLLQNKTLNLSEYELRGLYKKC